MKRENRASWLAFGAIMVALSIMAGCTIYYAWNHAHVPEPAKETTSGWRPPPLHKCPDDAELWDCIRHAMYRRDM